MRFYQAVLATSLPVDATGRAQLLPATDFAARDGRPGPGKKWRLDDTRGQAIAAALTAICTMTPVVIDYDHQTLFVQQNGQPAPAAGWMQRAEWLSGQGLFTTVEWTEPAKARINAGEYRYISPVINYDAAGNVTGVALAALCNYPAIVGMHPAVAALSTQFTTNHQEPNMDLLTALLASLGLATGTTQEAALTAVAALKAERDQLKARPVVSAALTTELGLAATADEAAVLTAVKGLKTADTGTLAVVTGLQQQLAALTAQINEGGVVKLVDDAIAAGKFAPAHRDWLLAQGRRDQAALTVMLTAAPVIPGLNGQTAGRTDGEQAAALTAEADRVRIAAGLSPEQWAKAAKQAA